MCCDELRGVILFVVIFDFDIERLIVLMLKRDVPSFTVTVPDY